MTSAALTSRQQRPTGTRRRDPRLSPADFLARYSWADFYGELFFYLRPMPPSWRLSLSQASWEAQ
jgi:hypothetical protein